MERDHVFVMFWMFLDMGERWSTFREPIDARGEYAEFMQNNCSLGLESRNLLELIYFVNSLLTECHGSRDSGFICVCIVIIFLSSHLLCHFFPL